MSHAEFSIAYDGPALANHTMEVQTLAPALLAFGEMCEEANRVLNGEDAPEISVNVVATSEGCFDITLQVANTVRELVSWTSTEDVKSAKEILEWIGILSTGVVGGLWITGGGLMKFLKWKAGRRIKAVEESEGNGERRMHITVEGSTDTHITIHQNTYKLSRSHRVRASHKKTLDPLREDGINEFHVREQEGDDFSIDAKEVAAGYYDIYEDEIDVSEPLTLPQRVTAFLELRSPMFVPGKSWRFGYGDTPIFAKLSDDSFTRRVFEEGERFGAGDVLQVHMEIKQMVNENGNIVNRYEILQVIATYPKEKQIGLFGTGGSSED